MANITLRQLRALVEICRTGKLVLASERLHVTPGALSMLLKQLESELGTTLFERGSRKLLPTDVARHAVELAERVLANARQLEDEVKNFQSLARGRVSLASTPGLANQFLPAPVLHFRATYPNVAVSIEDCAPDQLLPLVSSGHCDLGVGSPDLPGKDLEWDVLATGRICIICRHDNPLAAYRSLRWSVLAEHEFITLKRESGIRRLIDQTLLELGMNVRPSIERTYFESVLALTQAGLAIAVLPSSLVKRSTHGAGLVMRPLIAPTVKRDILLLRKRGRTLPTAAARFREIMLSQLSETAERDA